MCPRPIDDPERLVLASSSPRRVELLTRAGLELEVIASDIPEDTRPNETPTAAARRLAQEKALTVARRLGATPRRWVIGADTIVVVDGVAIGKPRDPDHAVTLLSTLVGRRHEVITGVAVVDTASLRVWEDVVESAVEMRPASLAELRSYVATGEPLDKAGAYALQGRGRRFVDRVEGSESNVIGLPVEQTLALLRRAQAESGS
jgi:septum formation protein